MAPDVFWPLGLPPGCLCAAEISVLPLPPVGHRSYRWAVTQPGFLSPSWRCSGGVADCHSKCDRTESPVKKKGEMIKVFRNKLHIQEALRTQFPCKQFSICSICFTPTGCLCVSAHFLYKVLYPEIRSTISSPVCLSSRLSLSRRMQQRVWMFGTAVNCIQPARCIYWHNTHSTKRISSLSNHSSYLLVIISK